MARRGEHRRRITRDDLEAKFREVAGEVEETTESMRNVLVAVGGGLLVLVLILTFLFGRRRGAKKTTVVEIRRV